MVARNWGVAYLSLLSRRYLPYLRLFAAGPFYRSPVLLPPLVALPPSLSARLLYLYTTRPDIFLLDSFRSCAPG